MSVRATSTTPRREATRRKLMDAAAEVFGEIGVDAASVEAICERAGFTRGAFYSNFDSKDELMLALTRRISDQKIEQVTARARALAATEGALDVGSLVRGIMDVAVDRRIGILLTSEIRTRAMRDPQLARTYLDWQRGMVERVGAVIAQLADAYRFTLRLPAEDFAQLILQSWEDTAVGAVIEGHDYDEVCTRVNEHTARLAIALVDPPA